MTTRSPIQISTQINTRNITLSADTAEEAVELSKKLTEVADDLLDSFTTLDQMIMAKTPTATQSAPSTPQSSTQVPSSPPPSGDTPSCPVHGLAKDFAGRYSKSGKPYGSRYYCSSYGCETFKPQGQWVA